MILNLTQSVKHMLVCNIGTLYMYVHIVGTCVHMFMCNPNVQPHTHTLHSHMHIHVWVHTCMRIHTHLLSFIVSCLVGHSTGTLFLPWSSVCECVRANCYIVYILPSACAHGFWKFSPKLLGLSPSYLVHMTQNPIHFQGAILNI